MIKQRKINIRGNEIIIFQQNKDDYISLTDIAKYKNSAEPRFVIQNWMKTRYTVDFLGIWEQIHNSNFNRVEFDTFILSSVHIFCDPNGVKPHTILDS